MNHGQPQCVIRTVLSRAEQAWLDSLPGVIEPAEQSLVCALGAGHIGPHHAVGQAACQGDQWWWVLWSDQDRGIVQIDPCHAEEPGVHEADGCLLCFGHPGPHSFQLNAG